MDLKIVEVNPTNAYIVKNFIPLFHHDISEWYEFLPNEHGIVCGSENIKTLGEHYENSNKWFDYGLNTPESFFPFLIYADNLPAGFAIVLGKGNEEIPENTDYFMNLYFVLGAYRGRGVARQAAHILFDKFKGKWLIYTNSTSRNVKGQKFWHSTINSFTGGIFKEKIDMTIYGEKMIFEFISR